MTHSATRKLRNIVQEIVEQMERKEEPGLGTPWYDRCVAAVQAYDAQRKGTPREFPPASMETGPRRPRLRSKSFAFATVDIGASFIIHGDSRDENRIRRLTTLAGRRLGRTFSANRVAGGYRITRKT